MVLTSSTSVKEVLASIFSEWEREEDIRVVVGRETSRNCVQRRPPVYEGKFSKVSVAAFDEIGSGLAVKLISKMGDIDLYP
jgi:hypothetical protein